MNLFLREMKASRKSLIIWCVCLLFMVVAGMSKYEAYSSTSGQSINKMISQMPKSLQALMGAGVLDLSTIIGFYGMVFAYLLLMAAIHTLMLGANIIAKEERDKTTEFLMVKPISRTKIITVKLVAALVNVLIFNLVTLIFSLIMVAKYSKGAPPQKEIYLLQTGLFLLQLIFMTIGTGIASISRRPKRAVSFGTAILLVMYILSIAIDMNSKLEGLKYLTPFKYYEAKRVLVDGALDPIFVAISVAVILVLIVVTYVFYKKRDLHV